jgi:hypothetical protein
MSKPDLISVGKLSLIDIINVILNSSTCIIVLRFYFKLAVSEVNNMGKQNGILRFLGVILLGAIGSGVWEYLIKPITNKSSNIILNIITFNINSFKSQLYTDIAKGYTQDTILSIMLSNLLIFLLCTIILTMIGVLMHYLCKDLISIQNKLYGLECDKEESEKPTLLEKIVFKFSFMEKLSHNITLRQIAMFIYYIGITITIMGVMLAMKYSYVNKAITYYKQLITIVTPFVDNKQIQKYDSDFAQMKSESDYSTIIYSLQDIIKLKKLKAP